MPPVAGSSPPAGIVGPVVVVVGAGVDAGPSCGGKGAVASSTTVTVNVDDAEFPAPSVAVHVTVVTPTAKNAPDGSAHVTVGPTPELSDAAGSGNVTGTGPFGVVCTRSGRSAIVGGSLSTTVTVNVPDAVCAAALSVAVQVTVVAPSGKKLPAAGTQVTTIGAVPPVVVGAAQATTAPACPGSFGRTMFAGVAIVSGSGSGSSGASSSRIVPVASPSSTRDSPIGLSIVRISVSSNSSTTSPMIGTFTSNVEAPAAKVAVPVVVV